MRFYEIHICRVPIKEILEKIDSRQDDAKVIDCRCLERGECDDSATWRQCAEPCPQVYDQNLEQVQFKRRIFHGDFRNWFILTE